MGQPPGVEDGRGDHASSRRPAAGCATGSRRRRRSRRRCGPHPLGAPVVPLVRMTSAGGVTGLAEGVRRCRSAASRRAPRWSRQPTGAAPASRSVNSRVVDDRDGLLAVEDLPELSGRGAGVEQSTSAPHLLSATSASTKPRPLRASSPTASPARTPRARSSPASRSVRWSISRKVSGPSSSISAIRSGAARRRRRTRSRASAPSGPRPGPCRAAGQGAPGRSTPARTSTRAPVRSMSAPSQHRARSRRQPASCPGGMPSRAGATPDVRCPGLAYRSACSTQPPGPTRAGVRTRGST